MGFYKIFKNHFSSPMLCVTTRYGIMSTYVLSHIFMDANKH